MLAIGGLGSNFELFMIELFMIDLILEETRFCKISNRVKE